MANVRLSYDLPTKRADGKNLPINEIRHVSIFLSADSGANFAKVADNPPSSNEYLQTELEAGLWVFRFVVEDTLGQKSSAVDKSVNIIPAVPNPVSNVQALVE